MDSKKPKALMSWSSGKDSAYALYQAKKQGEVEVVGLLTTVTENFDRVSMHGVRRRLLKAQAKAANLPLVEVLIPSPCSNEIYLEKMKVALQQAKAEGVEVIIFGDLYLEDIRQYRLDLLKDFELQAYFPLWGKDTTALAHEMIGAGIGAHIACLDPRKLGAEFAGRLFNTALLEALPESVDPCGENGEFHTFVFAGPQFEAPIACEVGEVVERGGFIFADILPAGEALAD